MSMEKEIGGYFGLETFQGREYYPDLLAVNSARNALLYLLKAKKIKKIYIPYFLCDSVFMLCEREKYEYEYYSINQDFTPNFSKELSEGEYLYCVNFYGQITNSKIKQLRKQYKNLIIDNVQAFFQKPVKGVDTLYSCRKFFGVPDGAYVYTPATLDEKLKTDESKERMKHILGRFEGQATEYYSDFKDNDESFIHLELRLMSKLTQNILRAVDYKQVKRKRNENYKTLEMGLGQYNPLKLNRPDGAYCYPFYCKNGMQIKKKLAEKKIYVPTLWANAVEIGGEIEKDYAKNILPLPCDQRYGKEEMEYMIRQVLECIN